MGDPAAALGRGRGGFDRRGGRRSDHQSARRWRLPVTAAIGLGRECGDACIDAEGVGGGVGGVGEWGNSVLDAPNGVDKERMLSKSLAPIIDMRQIPLACRSRRKCSAALFGLGYRLTFLSANEKVKMVLGRVTEMDRFFIAGIFRCLEQARKSFQISANFIPTSICCLFIKNSLNPQ